MAVSGIRLQSVAQFIPKSGTQQRTQRQQSTVFDAASKLNTAGSSQKAVSLLNSQNPSQATKAVLFSPVQAILGNLKSSIASRSTDQSTRRNTLQQDFKQSTAPNEKALQKFQDVANFERKDALANLVGLDIFV